MVVWRVKGKEAPGGNQTADVARHDICSDGGAARRVGDDVCRDLCITQGAKDEGAAGDEKRSAIADLRVRADKEHDVADHHEGRGADVEDVAPVKLGAQPGETRTATPPTTYGGTVCNCCEMTVAFG